MKNEKNIQWRARAWRLVMLAAAPLALTACASISHDQLADDQAQVISGPTVTDNRTPLEHAFQCMSGRITATGRQPVALTVGNVKDYTGKFSELDGGNPITQGGALMVISALGKLGPAVNLRERFDTQVAEIELAYLNKRYLGDGGTHRVKQNGNGIAEVPWLPYIGGSIIKSDYYIVGGITELNYNIQSGGAELFIKGTGGKGRVFVVNVAVDLRIVNTETLNVEKTVSLQKQLVGYEVAASIFRFFGDILVDFNAGTKSQEPMQLGVRTALELGVLELVGHVSGVDHQPCLNGYGESDQQASNDRVVEQPAETTRVAENRLPAPSLYDDTLATGSSSSSADAMSRPLLPLTTKVTDVSARSEDVSQGHLLAPEVDSLMQREAARRPSPSVAPIIGGGS